MEGKTVSADLNKTYWATRKDKNGEYKFETTYADGNYHGYLEFDQYVPAGEYCIESVYLSDRAGNSRTLYGPGWMFYKDSKVNKTVEMLPDEYKDLKITVTNKNGIADVTPPTLTQFEVSETSIEVPEKIEFVADAEDDISGADLMYVTFRDKETDKSLWAEMRKSDTADDGKFHGSVYVDRYTPSGEYYIDHITVIDDAGNGQHLLGAGSTDYDRLQKDAPEKVLPERYKDLKITVINGRGMGDVTPPTFNGIELERTSIETPGRIEVVGDAEDDISEIDIFSVVFSNKETGKTISCYLSDKNPEGVRDIFGDYSYETPYEDGKFHGYIYVNEYIPAGDYYMDSIRLKDEADNGQTWYGFGAKDYDLYLKNEPEKLLSGKYTDLKIRVTNTGITLDSARLRWVDIETTSDIYFHHWVEKGDTLWALSKKYKTTVDELMSLNPDIEDRSLIYVGQLIKYRKYD